MSIKNVDMFIEHVGIPHNGPIPHSGRYEYGSGENPYQDEDEKYNPIDTIHNEINKLRSKGITSEKDICSHLSKKYGYEINSNEVRKLISIDKQRLNAYNISYAIRLHEKGYSISSIAKKMDISEKRVNNYLNPLKQKKYMALRETADYLKKIVDETGKPVDVGEGVHNLLECSPEHLSKAVRLLRMEGYNYLRHKIPQMSTGNRTQGVFLFKPDGNLTKSELRQEFNDYMKNSNYEIPTCNIKENRDGIKIYEEINKPVSLDPKRILINYATEDNKGGALKDGVIELRRGVGDLDMGGKNYAQVRILVGKDRYLKGMAVYADDIPEGYDIRFNTNKKSDVPMDEVLKKTKNLQYDTGIPTDVLGSYIKRQNFYVDKDGKIKQGVLNIINEQDDSWSTYSNTLAAQFLSKQKSSTAEKQLKIAIDDKKQMLKEINSLTNPIIKQHYLQDFAQECEKDADCLKAAAFPRQSWNVILPVTSLRENEIFAPQFDNGEKIALIRYPHAGTFEIPVLTVNNRNKEGLRVIGNKAQDAVGIHPQAAKQLSGADFDGDTVLAIPNNDGKISSKSTLKELENYADKMDSLYPAYEGMKILKGKDKQKQMGVVSNLIMDMTILGASDQEIARATRCSMVVIDAEKHKLNWKQAYEDENIKQLQRKWQIQLDENGNIIPNRHGAATIVSRAKSEIEVPKKTSYYHIDEDGNKYSFVYEKDKNGEIKKDKNGKRVILKDENGNPLRDYSLKSYETRNVIKKQEKTYSIEDWPPKDIDINAKYDNNNKIYSIKKIEDINGNITGYKVSRKVRTYDESGNPQRELATEKTTRMKATNNAETLISSYNTKIERVYADYANELKRLSKEAYKNISNIPKYEQSQSAKEIYKEEVQSLTKKLQLAGTFKPLERKAQSLANKIYRQIDEQTDEGIDKSDEKKEQNKAIAIARALIVSSSKDPVKLKSSKRITLTDREWEAIQAKAITKQMLKDLINNTDKDDLRNRSMPKEVKKMSNSEISRAKRLLDMGYTLKEVAKHLGYSESKIQYNIKGE